MSRFARICAAVALGAAFIVMAPVAWAESGIYTVRGVPVDATGPSATSARDAAIPQGRAVAWSRLFRRLTAQDQWGNQPQLDEATLANLILSFEVSNERTSSTRYLARMTYTFKSDGVRDVLRNAGIPFSEARAKPVVVVPILEQGGATSVFGGDNGWAKAWNAAGLSDELVPLMAPMGDAEDVAAVGGGATWETLQTIAAKYGASEVMLARAQPSGGYVSVTVTRVSEQGAIERTYSGSGTDEADAYARVIADVSNEIQQEWKTKTALDASLSGSFTVTVNFASLSEWIAIRKRLAGISNVTDTDLESITVDKAILVVAYRGRREQLDVALRDAGLGLIPMPPPDTGYRLGSAEEAAALDGPSPPSSPQ